MKASMAKLETLVENLASKLEQSEQQVLFNQIPSEILSEKLSTVCNPDEIPCSRLMSKALTEQPGNHQLTDQ